MCGAKPILQQPVIINVLWCSVVTVLQLCRYAMIVTVKGLGLRGSAGLQDVLDGDWGLGLAELTPL